MVSSYAARGVDVWVVLAVSPEAVALICARGVCPYTVIPAWTRIGANARKHAPSSRPARGRAFDWCIVKMGENYGREKRD